MKKSKNPRLTNANHWENMDGDSEIEKRLNSYLTCQFIMSQDIPSDECLSEAQYIIDMVRRHDKHYRLMKLALETIRDIDKSRVASAVLDEVDSEVQS